MDVAVRKPGIDGHRVVARGDAAVWPARTPAAQLGFWSAVAAAISSAAFMLGVALGIFGVLTHPWDAAAALVPSIILAPSLVALFGSVHQSVPVEKRVWSHAAVAFACVYAPLCTVAYAVELSVVQPLVLRGQADQVALFTLSQYGTQPNTVFSAFDGLGYAFVSLACLFAAPIFHGNRLERWIRWMLIGTGVIISSIQQSCGSPHRGDHRSGFSVLLAFTSSDLRCQCNWRPCHEAYSAEAFR